VSAATEGSRPADAAVDRANGDGDGGRAPARARSGDSFRRFAWLGLLVVTAVALVVGGTREPTARTADEQREERTNELAESVMCPTCRGQSVADSDASAARGIRTYINRRVEEGAGDDQIRNELADRYGEDVLLTPGRSGLSGLVWTLPVAALVAALVGIGFAFHHWRRRDTVTVTDADRQLVGHALDDLPTGSR
jgi:cytochrome c-type biogenesis protein CcmH/NrfF